MVAALELYFDHVAERRMRVLWDALEGDGIPSLRGLLDGKHRPHLSLVGASALDPAVVKEALDGFDVAPALKLSFQFAGVFVGRVLWLGPSPSVGLLGLQAEAWRRLTVAGLALSPLYAPGAWVPHATVSMRVPRPVLTEALRRCLETLPIEATVVGAAVADHARGIFSSLRGA
jgi:2'-5' RNA ligase superfamily